MKKVFLLLAFVLCTITASIAQSTPSATSNAPSSTSKNESIYICPACKHTSTRAGTCAHCQTAYIKNGTYYCPACYMEGKKGGKCKHCDQAYIEMKAEAAPVKSQNPASKQ